MEYIVDIIIVLIISLSTYIGYRRGLIKAVLHIFSFVLAIILALALYKPMSNIIINSTEIDDSLKTTIYEKLAPQELTVENAQALQEQSVPQNIIDNITKYIQDASTDAQEDVATVISEKLTELIINVGVGILVFIIAKILLSLIKVIGEWIAKIPIIKQLNKVGGLAYGVIRGILIVYVAFALIMLINPLINSTTVIDNINKSYLGKGMYKNNIILSILL